MKKFIVLVAILLAFCMFSSCKKIRNSTEEFNTVIEYYSQRVADSLKLKAAKFLIKDLRGLPTLDTISVNPNHVAIISNIKPKLNNEK